MHLRVLMGFSGAGRRLVALAMCLSLSGCYWLKFLSERRFVVAARERARCRGTAPRVVLGLLCSAPPAPARTPAAAAESAAPAATATRLVHLGGRVLQR